MAPETKKEKFVTEKEFNELSTNVNTLVELVKQSLKESGEVKAKIDAIPATPEKAKEEVEVTKAGPKPYITPVNPEWEQVARDIIGTEKVERCEMQHGRTGGLTFTVVIKKEHSNAPDAYLAVYKEDKRSKEIGAEGIGGVEVWAKLIKQNLTRGKAYK